MTLPLSFRIENLKKLKNALIKNEAKLEEALYKDLGRSECEAPRPEQDRGAAWGGMSKFLYLTSLEHR